MRKYNSLGHLCDLNLAPLSDYIMMQSLLYYHGCFCSQHFLNLIQLILELMEIFSLTSVSFRLGSKWPFLFSFNPYFLK